MKHLRFWLLGVLVAIMGRGAARSDEGMWLLNDPPRDRLKKQHQFDLTDAWLERAMKASVRFNNGGSGGFVSPDGLIVTNHHIGADSLQKLSVKGRDLLRDGFLATSRDKELRCPDLELNVLQSIEDVTDKVNAAVKPDMKPDEAFAARRAVMSRIEKESLEATGLRSDVVTLYSGGLYHLYRYKKYTDVRLVFAPEENVAAFGGDPDNFEYPRHGLDVCFFRAYENGKPAKVQHWFRWATTGPKEGDLVFVTGHPGRTERQETLARLRYRRDVGHPYLLARLRTLEAALRQFSEASLDQARITVTDLHRVANARKAISGQYQGLLDPAILEIKAKEERALRQRFKTSQARGPDPWERIESALKKAAEFEKRFLMLEAGHAFSSELFSIARHVVRLPAELKLPSAERLREYSDARLDSLKFQLYSPAPIHASLERVKLATSLTFLAENLGGSHPLVTRILAGKPPVRRAEELIAGTRLQDVAERKRLVEAGVEAVKKSDDAMIQLALLIDDEARRLRKRYESEIEEVERQAYGQIAAVRFAAHGRKVAPDATFTLRLAFGVVKGYEVAGEKLPFHTTFASAFERAEKQGHREPFNLPRRWLEGKDKLNLKTPFNFVSTADTIGGNSGSPVLNRAGELVGINFDRNRHGLVRNYVYTEEQARHISVHGLAVLEALKKLYGAEKLAKELTGS